MFKFTILQSFIDKYSHLPQQGTDEWKKLRQDFIGGSEVSTILKQNKNKTVSKLILGKLGFDPFKGNVITHWGNVFEELIRLHCEDTFGCSIRETGSIPYKDGKLSYSPDGLAVVPTSRLMKRFGKLANGLDPISGAQLVLFEFKCPHSRIPSEEIPEHYWPQVNIGMNIIDIMETGIFVQAVYRRCSFDALKYNKHHTAYGHYKRADTSNDPIECGFMVVYIDEDSGYRNDLLSTFDDLGIMTHFNEGFDIADLGDLTDNDILEEVLGNCVNKLFKIDYCFRYTYKADTFSRGEYTIDMYNQSLQYRARKELERQYSKHPNIIGIIPYKMLSVYMTAVDKNPNYIKETDAHFKATAVLQCINDHQGLTDKADVAKSIRKYKL